MDLNKSQLDYLLDVLNFHYSENQDTKKDIIDINASIRKGNYYLNQNGIEKLHHVLYEWSELVEIDQRLNRLNEAIQLTKELNKLLYNSDNKELLEHSHAIQKELETQFQEIQSIFNNRLKKTNLT